MTQRRTSAALTQARWRKSSRSDNAAGCVELADLGQSLAVRDSKHPAGPVLVFAVREFRAFLAATTH